MSETRESSESSPRMRWFQFDLRLLFVVVAAVAVILALEMAHRSAAQKAKGLTSTIRVGEQVILEEHPQGFEIKRQKGAHSHTVTEVGTDYVRLQSIDGPVSVIPLEKIYRIVDDPRPYGAAAGGRGMGGMAAGPGGSGAAGGFGPPGSFPGIIGSGGATANGAVPVEDLLGETLPTEAIGGQGSLKPPTKGPPTTGGGGKP